MTRTDCRAPSRLTLSEALRVSRVQRPMSRAEIRAFVSRLRRERFHGPAVSMGEASFLLCRDRSTVRALIRSGRLPAEIEMADASEPPETGLPRPGVRWRWRILTEDIDALPEMLEAPEHWLDGTLERAALVVAECAVDEPFDPEKSLEIDGRIVDIEAEVGAARERMLGVGSEEHEAAKR